MHLCMPWRPAPTHTHRLYPHIHSAPTHLYTHIPIATNMQSLKLGQSYYGSAYLIRHLARYLWSVVEGGAPWEFPISISSVLPQDLLPPLYLHVPCITFPASSPPPSCLRNHDSVGNTALSFGISLLSRVVINSLLNETTVRWNITSGGASIGEMSECPPVC